MNAVKQFWQNFARWVKRGHVAPLPITFQNTATGAQRVSECLVAEANSLKRELPRNKARGTLDLVPVETWAARKADYDRARRAHRGQADAYAHLRKATHDRLAHDACMRAARADLDDLSKTVRTLRETLAFGEETKR